MSRAQLAALLLIPAAAFAQTPPASAKPAEKKPAATTQDKAASTPAPAATAPKTDSAATTTAAAPATSTTPAAADTDEKVRREVAAQLEAAKQQLREELRAELQSAPPPAPPSAWQQEAAEERRKLELFQLDGYFRSRPDLFYKFDLNREFADSTPTKTLWPISPASAREHTIAGVNMRVRLDPTLNVSEEVRLKMQIDALDNVVWGSTPDYAFSRSDRTDFGLLSESQVPPTSGINALQDSIVVKRAYGEVSTPVGIFRFGRMGSHWGLGMLHNDGNCFDCDYGDTVDRLQFVTEPFPGWFIAPMIDFNSEGPTSGNAGQLGQPYDVSQADDAHSWVLAVARRDTDQQVKAKLENNQPVINYGLHFTFRTQGKEATSFLTAPFTNPGGGSSLAGAFASRAGIAYIPDFWFKWEQKNFRIELEAAAVIAWNHIQLTGTETRKENVFFSEYGAVLQGDYRLLDGKLKLGGEVGFASGDQSPGLGNFPGRKGSAANDLPELGDVEGAQWGDARVSNFRFNQDYRVDMILFREILGGITDALYVKPTIDYQLADGLSLYGAVIYSRGITWQSVPAAQAAWTDDAEARQYDLGLELNAGARYETEDGFHFELQYGMLFPLAGLRAPIENARELENAQTLRAKIGIKF